MRCVSCKREIKEGAAFCPYCGVKQEQVMGAPPQPVAGEQFQQQPMAGNAPRQAAHPQASAKKGKGKAVLIAAVAVVLIAASLIAVFFLRKPGGEEASAPAETAEETAGGSATDGGEAAADDGGSALAEGNQLEWAELLLEGDQTPLYEKVSLTKVDLAARDSIPGTKVMGTIWDNSLFYWLEDCDTTSDEDGYIAKCRVTKTLLSAKDTKDRIQCEIYRDPDNGEIYKIVTIRETADGLELTDYYYQSGKPNFIFLRTDSVYTPTYATIDKVGERYYFNNDVMVRWRIITEPGQIGEYTLNPEKVWYSQANYFTEGEEIRHIYDDKEWEMLNRAYNVLKAVKSDSGIGRVEGYVKDTLGNPVPEAEVLIYRREDGKLLYRKQSGEDGRFTCNVYLDGSECYLIVRADAAVYKLTAVDGLNLTESALLHNYDRLLVHKAGGDLYPVSVEICAANEARTDEDGKFTSKSLSDATVNFREGSGIREGGILYTGKSGSDGKVTVNLPSGVYTAEIVVSGYVTGYLEVEVAEQEKSCTGWVLPTPAQEQTAVVLTWEGDDLDLDLTVFTPYQSTGGDMAHVGGGVDADGKGNLLMADNRSGCEVVYLNTSEAGSFKIYVNDYTDSTAGKFDAKKLSKRNVRIYIYDVNGYVAEYAYPSGQSGVVWEVAEVNRGRVTPIQRAYAEISGKNFWVSGKGAGAGEQPQEAPAFTDNDGWKQDYIEKINSYEKRTDIEAGSCYYGLVYVNEDDIPELLITYASGAVMQVDLCGFGDDLFGVNIGGRRAAGYEVPYYKERANTVYSEHEYDMDINIGGDTIYGYKISDSNRVVNYCVVEDSWDENGHFYIRYDAVDDYGNMNHGTEITKAEFDTYKKAVTSKEFVDMQEFATLTAAQMIAKLQN